MVYDSFCFFTCYCCIYQGGFPASSVRDDTTDELTALAYVNCHEILDIFSGVLLLFVSDLSLVNVSS